VDDAIEITRNAWTSRYKPSATSATTAAAAEPTVCFEYVLLFSCLMNVFLQDNRASSSNAFISLMARQTQAATPPSNADELDRYLADSCVPTDDPLHWWIMNRKVYPNLAKLAISVHSIPGRCLFFEG